MSRVKKALQHVRHQRLQILLRCQKKIVWQFQAVEKKAYAYRDRRVNKETSDFLIQRINAGVRQFDMKYLHLSMVWVLNLIENFLTCCK